MLRDDLEVAVSELIVALRDACHAYRTAAELAHDPDLAALFSTSGERHEALAASLEVELKALGYLPEDVDSERELVRDMVTHIKAALSADETAALLDERRQDEERIIACGKAALDQFPPERLRSIVNRGIEQARSQAETLAGRAAPSSGAG